MDQPITKSRNIELDNEEYTFPFDSPTGAEQLMECTITSDDDAGTVTLYELVNNEKVQVGDSHILTRKTGGSFYIALKTPRRNSQWEITFRGTGRFRLEFPDIESDDPLYPKSVKKEKLTTAYDRKGIRKKSSK